MTPGRLFYLSVVLILSASLASVMAQESLPFEGPAAERIEQYKKIRLMDFLQLDEETSIRFFSRYNRFGEDLRALNGKRNSLVDELQRLVRRDAGEAEFRKVFDQLDGLGGEMAVLRHNYMEEISELLPAKKVAAYIVFERNFYRNLRDLLREAQKERSDRKPR